MAMTIPNPDPELPPVERFFSFTESEDEHHGVKVTRIGMDGNIAIEDHGKSHDLTLRIIVTREPVVKEEETGQGKARFQCQTAYPDQRPRADSATSRRAGKKGKWFQPQSIPSFGPQ